MNSTQTSPESPSNSGNPRAETEAAAGRERHQRVVGRVRRSQFILAAAGLAAWGALGGTREALSFAVGAGASLASFGLLDRLTAAVGGNAVSKPMVAASALRILLVGGLLFAILQNYSLHPLAAATGLLITVGAILAEALFGSLF